MDTKTAVWVSTAEKFSKLFWEKLGIFLESLGGSQRQLCIKTRPLIDLLIPDGGANGLAILRLSSPGILKMFASD